MGAADDEELTAMLAAVSRQTQRLGELLSSGLVVLTVESGRNVAAVLSVLATYLEASAMPYTLDGDEAPWSPTDT